MRKYNSILFVCEDNTATSLMAECICKSMVADQTVQIKSRGMVVLFPEPINPKVEVVLVNHGLKVPERTALMLDADDIDENTLVLTMTIRQKEQILEEFEYTGNVYTLYGFIGDDMNMEDPYGGTLVEYDSCFQTMFRVIKKIVVKLKKTYGLQDTETMVE